MPQDSPIDFTRGVPAVESFPVDELVTAAEAALRTHAAVALQYGPALGFAPFREWVAGWLGVKPEQVLTGNGSLQLIDVLGTHLLGPGDVVLTESPTYDRTITILRRHGAEVVGVPLGPEGPDLDAVEAAMRERRPKLVYVIPDFQNPTGATWSTPRRERLVELAARYDVLLVEDAPYRLLRYRGEDRPSLHSLAPERVVHMGSLTKLLAPGLRIGYLVGPAPLVAKLAKVAEDTYISPGFLSQAIAYEWCRRDLMPGRVRQLRALYGPRLDACRSAIERHLPTAEATRPDGGFFVSLTLPPGVQTAAVRAAAAERGLRLADGAAFFPNGGGDRFLRLPFCALSQEDIERGIERLAGVIAAVSR